MKFHVLSLKQKSLNQLLDEVNEKDIWSILDVRRSPINSFNSAAWFLRDALEAVLFEKGVHYMHLPIFSNRKRVDNDKDFFTDDITTALAALQLPSVNYGILCYCNKTTQIEGDCHAVWVANYLKDTRYLESEVIV